MATIQERGKETPTELRQVGEPKRTSLIWFLFLFGGGVFMILLCYWWNRSSSSKRCICAKHKPPRCATRTTINGNQRLRFDDFEVTTSTNMNSTPIHVVNTVNLLVSVIDEDWGDGLDAAQPYWEKASTSGTYGVESHVYHVAIFLKQNKVVLYDFSLEFVKGINKEVGGIKIPSDGEEFKELRDSFALSIIDFQTSVPERSADVVEAFSSFYEIILSQTPHERMTLTYVGHGGPDGDLFEGVVVPEDAVRLLNAYVTQSGGKKFALLNFGGNCNLASMRVLGSIGLFADYIYASSLSVGGYQMDKWTSEKSRKSKMEFYYGSLFVSTNSIEDILKQFNDIFFTNNWLEATAYMTKHEIRQSQSTFRMEEYADFETDYFDVFPEHTITVSDENGEFYMSGTLPRDVRQRIINEAPTPEDRDRLLMKLEAVQIDYISNNNATIVDPSQQLFFVWSEEDNGLQE